MTRGARLAVAGLSLALFASDVGCALLTKADPVVPRYFSPESADGSVSGAAARQVRATPGLELQLGRVGGGSYLKERIVYRQGDHELGLYEDCRWTERPEIFLRRALERALFEQRGIERKLSGAAPTLTADLVEFEEVRGPHPLGRIRVTFALHDDRSVLRERTLTVERPIAGAGSGASGTVAALGEALGQAVDEIAEEVVEDLRRHLGQQTPPAEAAVNR